MVETKPVARFVTFYSFKGGVGRSMALINTAGILAGRGFRVLVIDLDLEAPGLSYLDPSAPTAPASELGSQLFHRRLGFVDLLTDAKARGQESDLFSLSANECAQKYTHRYQLPDDLLAFKDGSLSIMPAGCFDGNYTNRFDELDLKTLYQEGLGEPLIRTFKKTFAEAGLYDYVLVDSRTGFSDEAGICTRDLADHLMILSGLNRQNVAGTSAFLRALRAATDKNKTFDVILSPVPNGEDSLVDEREGIARKEFEAAWGNEVILDLQIPYHPQLALTEEPHIFRRRRGYLFEAYRAIERQLLNALGTNTSTLLGRLNDAFEQRRYAAALNDLKVLIRLDDGKHCLRLAIPRSRWRTKGVGFESESEDPLASAAADPNGLLALEFIVENLPDDDGMLAPLARQLGDTSKPLARALYRRVAESPSQSSDDLAAAAAFFAQEDNDFARADQCYRRCAETSPNSAVAISAYATWLAHQHKNLTEAERLYARASELSGNFPIYISDYAQCIAGQGRFAEAQTALLTVVEGNLEALETTIGLANSAELYLSLWLITTALGQESQAWESRFSRLVHIGFPRHPWSFEAMLTKAKEALPSDIFEYAQALAAAFLDEEDVPALEGFERWRALEIESAES
jgi:cellulose biosynthesis protein BcsQ/cytochrome c-type biogenesis protein CcmH/NrfG